MVSLTPRIIDAILPPTRLPGTPGLQAISGRGRWEASQIVLAAASCENGVKNGSGGVVFPSRPLPGARLTSLTSVRSTPDCTEACQEEWC
jgi:hypothetical protein